MDSTDAEASKPRVLIRTYVGRHKYVATALREDATLLASKSYRLASQSWMPGEYKATDYVMALLLCLLVGLFFAFSPAPFMAASPFALVLLYAVMVRPAGTLIVTFDLV